MSYIINIQQFMENYPPKMKFKFFLGTDLNVKCVLKDQA